MNAKPRYPHNTAARTGSKTTRVASIILSPVMVVGMISPMAWQHILLNGHFTFQSRNELIDLDALVTH